LGLADGEKQYERSSKAADRAAGHGASITIGSDFDGAAIDARLREQVNRKYDHRSSGHRA